MHKNISNRINQILKYQISYFGFFIVVLVTLSLHSVKNPVGFFEEIKFITYPFDAKGFLRLLTFLLVFILNAFAIYYLILVKNKSIFWSLGIIFSLVFGIDIFLQLIGNNRGITFEEVALFFDQKQLFSNLKVYSNQIVFSFILSLSIGLLFIYVRKKAVKYSNNWYGLLIFVVAVIASDALSRRVFLINNSSFPAPVKTTIYLFENIIHRKQIFNRNPLLKASPAKITEHNIIWVIDESVTGSILSVNGYNLKTTPYLESLEGNNNFINYGSVNSVTNCSATSNFYLRIGLSPHTTENISRDILDLPSIFQYAKKAGYSTYLIDAQASDDDFVNYLSNGELESVDAYITIARGVLPPDRDFETIKILDEIVENGPNFIILIKYGCHWPYVQNFIKEDARFHPYPSTTNLSFSEKNKPEIVNAYFNSILRNVDDWFKKFIEEVELDNTVVFYTSDHGQNLFEENTLRTHCSPTFPVSDYEFDVPLWILNYTDFEFRVNNHNEQIQIFSTTLQLLGYDSTIYDKYGCSLLRECDMIENRKSFVSSSEKIHEIRN